MTLRNKTNAVVRMIIGRVAAELVGFGAIKFGVTTNQCYYTRRDVKSRETGLISIRASTVPAIRCNPFSSFCESLSF